MGAAPPQLPSIVDLGMPVTVAPAFRLAAGLSVRSLPAACHSQCRRNPFRAPARASPVQRNVGAQRQEGWPSPLHAYRRFGVADRAAIARASIALQLDA